MRIKLAQHIFAINGLWFCLTLTAFLILINVSWWQLSRASEKTGQLQRLAQLLLVWGAGWWTLALAAEIVRSVKKGLYAVNFGGGQVDITNGKFVFSASEAYMIEDGKITYPVKGATLIGNGPEVMNRVSMVGNDLKLDEGVGICGKDGQSVPVGVGQPTLRIDALTVGGTRQ